MWVSFAFRACKPRCRSFSDIIVNQTLLVAVTERNLSLSRETHSERGENLTDPTELSLRMNHCGRLRSFPGQVSAPFGGASVHSPQTIGAQVFEQSNHRVWLGSVLVQGLGAGELIDSDWIMCFLLAQSAAAWEHLNINGALAGTLSP